MEYGLIGEKLGHSYSKDIHNWIGNYEYEIKEIAKENLNSFMTEKNFKAINVTIPYKQDVIPFLDSIDEHAKKIGAVNTIVNKNGKLFGYNTDFIGLRTLIVNAGANLEGKKVLILGTGGTSKTATEVAASLNAGQVLIVSRREGENCITYDDAAKNHNDAQIIINTTPCGMFPKANDMPIDLLTNENIVEIISYLNIVSSKTRKILYNDAVYFTGINVLHHSDKIRTVKICTAVTVIRINLNEFHIRTAF